MAALVLVGCTPPEPTEEEVVEQIHETSQGFFQAVSEQHQSGTASAEDLREYATEALAERWATETQALMDEGVSTRGASLVANIDLRDREPDQVDALICTDQSNVETSLADGTTIAPQEIIAWEARLVRSGDGPQLLLDTLEPTANASACG